MDGVTQVHIVYAHPSPRSFTHDLLEAFLGGLDEAGHPYTVSDLYAMEFRSEMTLDEYERESGHRGDAGVPEDVAAEQARLAAAEVWAFVYPVWWTDCPARLKGWFDRVWTVGYAYGPTRLRPARRALVLCAAGYTVEQLQASGCYQAMETVMRVDRIADRAQSLDFIVFGGSVLRSSDPMRWEAVRTSHLDQVAGLARSV
jgi:NAD(P)H dehydrogenase (quinone)